jgi:threonine dehydrogenase-like Zn-dependent dehydrogenase
MRANTWHGTKSVHVEEVPDPKILNARDAIVRITSTAVCDRISICTTASFQR